MICIFVGSLIENVKVLRDHNETSVLFTFEHNEYMLKVSRPASSIARMTFSRSTAC